MPKKFLDLGEQPLANSYLKKSQLKYKEKKLKLEIIFNEKNYLVSIKKKISKFLMFNSEYPYRSSQSKTMIKSFKEIAEDIKRRFNPKLTLEIGSNDGTFLKNFQKKRIIGIEPCKNVAKTTKKIGYKTIDKYWTIKLASKLFRKKKADIIYSANTLSHIEDLDQTFTAINIALNDYGVLVMEGPALLPCIKYNIYDQFYCEHIYVFSTISLKNILEKYELEIFDLKNLSTHGGSTRYFIKKKINKKIKIYNSVKNEIKSEIKFGLNKFSTYKKFAENIKKSRTKLKNVLKQFSLNNKKVIGYGATAKSCTVLNYCKIDSKLIRYFYDTTPDKINKFLPGSKIFIKKYKRLRRKDADIVFLGAWNFKKEILKKERLFLKEGGKFLTHIPKIKIISK